MDAGRHAARKRSQALAIAASAAFHAFVFVFLVWRLGASPGVAETPVMNVELATLPHEARRSRPEPPQRSEPAEARAPSARPIIPNLVVPQAVQPDGPALPLPDIGGAGVQQALRGLVGCAHADLSRLTPEERRRCQARQLAEAGRLKGAAPSKLNFDLTGRYAENPEPYLTRRPKNGCKVRVGGDVAPMGEQGGAGGVTCAWSF